MVTATSLPITCAHTMVIASDCVGLTLPGMIELPGSFSGIKISPIPQRGPEASQRTSLAIFMSATASVFIVPRELHERFMCAKRFEFVRCAHEG